MSCQKVILNEFGSPMFYGLLPTQAELKDPKMFGAR